VCATCVLGMFLGEGQSGFDLIRLLGEFTPPEVSRLMAMEDVATSCR
jgi:hypothetical protein